MQNSLPELGLTFPNFVAGFRRRKLRLQSGVALGNAIPAFGQVFCDSVH
jgi:hypothetical protein